MTRPLVLTALSIVSFAGCASSAFAASSQSSHLLASNRVDGKVSAPSGAKSEPAARAERRSRAPARPRREKPAMARVEAANRSAVHEPNASDFVGAVQVYPWSEGALYRLYAAPGKISDIALQPGETLVSVAAGDTLRWVIGDTSSGASTARQTHILVKPSQAGLATNLVIATDRRVYHLDAQSEAATTMSGIAWSYPNDALLALRGTEPEGGVVATAVPVDQLNFDYRIEGDKVSWRPIRVFDDGHQVFIQFPPELARGEAPPLFATGEKGQAELLNYRVHGLFYVVDRLFDAAELRMGEKHQKVVRILRISAKTGGVGRD